MDIEKLKQIIQTISDERPRPEAFRYKNHQNIVWIDCGGGYLRSLDLTSRIRASKEFQDFLTESGLTCKLQKYIRRDTFGKTKAFRLKIQ